MGLEAFWTLFLETGSPLAYLLYQQVLQGKRE